MGKILHVGHLSSSVTNEGLLVKFGPFGTVASADVIRDQHTGRSKGFAFIEMVTEAQAQTAIDRLNFSQYNGLTMSVRAPREPEQRQ